MAINHITSQSITDIYVNKVTVKILTFIIGTWHRSIINEQESLFYNFKVDLIKSHKVLAPHSNFFQKDDDEEEEEERKAVMHNKVFIKSV